MRTELVKQLSRWFNPPDLRERLVSLDAKVAEGIERDRAGLPPIDYDSAVNYVIAREVARYREGR